MHVLLRLAATKCPLSTFGSDEIRWAGNNTGNFTVSSAYTVRKGIAFGLEEDVWKLIHQIMTNKERVRRHVSSDSQCHLCHSPVEDIDHALCKCPHAFLVWRELVKPRFLTDF
ncbi:hypothetical protein V6N11_073366 [Hibiscus sabdariffa]|uniref:Reverse transcriptase zinc-binding domain-containing protein n=1 Tax=Hibiscus sabdariffa TaxID=183260 RepID=A0ABR2P4D4_9ROSI